MSSEHAPRVRHAIYKTFAEGGLPRAAALAHQLRLSPDEVHQAMHDLHDAHVIVLDPETRETWMAPPFSALPTLFTVEGGGRSWFANCAWDAFGIPRLAGVDAMITTTCQDCNGRIVYRVEEGHLVDAHGVVHFAVPAAKWWDDIGFT